MGNGQWAMGNGQWVMGNGQCVTVDADGYLLRLQFLAVSTLPCVHTHYPLPIARPAVRAAKPAERSRDRLSRVAQFLPRGRDRDPRIALPEVDDIERGDRPEAIEDGKADIHHAVDGIARAFVIAAPAGRFQACDQRPPARRRGATRAEYLGQVLIALLARLERRDHACRYPVIVKRKMC